MPDLAESFDDAAADALLRTGFYAEVVSNEGRVVLRLHGELDMATSPLLDSALRSALGDGVSEVVVDLARLTFLDSTGISVLLRGSRRADEVGTSFCVTAPNRPVRKALHLTGVDRILLVEPDEPLVT